MYNLYTSSDVLQCNAKRSVLILSPGWSADICLLYFRSVYYYRRGDILCLEQPYYPDFTASLCACALRSLCGLCMRAARLLSSCGLIEHGKSRVT